MYYYYYKAFPPPPISGLFLALLSGLDAIILKQSITWTLVLQSPWLNTHQYVLFESAVKLYYVTLNLNAFKIQFQYE